MKTFSSIIAAVALAAASGALAADAAPIRARQMVKTADGSRVGSIDRVIAGADGTPTAVQIIYKGRFVIIPAATLTSAEKGLVTSLTSKEVNKL